MQLAGSGVEYGSCISMRADDRRGLAAVPKFQRNAHAAQFFKICPSGGNFVGIAQDRERTLLLDFQSMPEAAESARIVRRFCSVRSYRRRPIDGGTSEFLRFSTIAPLRPDAPLPQRLASMSAMRRPGSDLVR